MEAFELIEKIELVVVHYGSALSIRGELPITAYEAMESIKRLLTKYDNSWTGGDGD